MKLKVWNGLVRNADENDIEILSSLLHKYRIFHGGKGQVEDARRFLLERLEIINRTCSLPLILRKEL